MSIPVLDMIGLTVAALQALDSRPRTIGILASPGVRLAGLVEAKCRAANLAIVYPEGADYSVVLDVFCAAKAGGVRCR